ncbi:chorismate mutase [Bifidobacterium bombi DSM 19703]|uniref:Chorismate mutase n=1 Tax=Bifidobacterium bombi DSM 19703 TaxID=1341695 RepID=A0A080N383_9BIFI|nr:chorismate mutase [Bifidobacterium bombi DSM 19703]
MSENGKVGVADGVGSVRWRDTTIDDALAAANPEVAGSVRRIKELRRTIDNIDTAITSLLAERFKTTARWGGSRRLPVLRPRMPRGRRSRRRASVVWQSMQGLTPKSHRHIANSSSEK